MSSQHYPDTVLLTEVGPRDGLQNEKVPIATEVKIALIEALQQAGVKKMEATAFVSPKWVPQMSDNREVMAGIERRGDVCYAALVPNMRGLDSALSANIDEVVIFGSASETFSQKNINCSIDESIERFRPVVASAKAQGLPVHGVISCTVICPYEGAIDPKAVDHVVQALVDIGTDTIGIADTIGAGTPLGVQRALDATLNHIAVDKVSCHFHDTYGQALANTLIALQMGVARFDTAVAGLGGCPYAPGAGGNVATEDVVYLLEGMGINTGINLDALIDVGEMICQHLNSTTRSRVARALLGKRQSH